MSTILYFLQTGFQALIEQSIRLALSILPDVSSMPTGFSTAWDQFILILKDYTPIFAFDTFLLVLLIIFSIEASVFLFKIILWIFKIIRG